MPLDPFFSSGYKKAHNHKFDPQWEHFQKLTPLEQHEIMDPMYRKKANKERLTDEEWVLFRRYNATKGQLSHLSRANKQEFLKKHKKPDLVVGGFNTSGSMRGRNKTPFRA